jgi:hypothetical protein
MVFSVEFKSKADSLSDAGQRVSQLMHCQSTLNSRSTRTTASVHLHRGQVMSCLSRISRAGRLRCIPKVVGWPNQTR